MRRAEVRIRERMGARVSGWAKESDFRWGLALSILLCLSSIGGAQESVKPSKSGRILTFRAGAVLSTSGSTKEMAEAKRGYELFAHKFNAQNRGRGMRLATTDGSNLFVRFDFQSFDDAGERENHDRLVRRLLDVEKVHFLMGSHPAYAFEETKMANDSGVLNIQCCVGPEKVYAQGHKYVFGVPASNELYTQQSLRSMALKGIFNVAIVYNRDNVFTRTTCLAAEKFIAELENIEGSLKTVLLETYTGDDANNTQFFKGVAERARANRAEAVIGCALSDDGKNLIDAFHNIKYPLKAAFLTVGPANQEWVERVGVVRSEGLLSSVQWHDGLNYEDSFFGNSHGYKRSYQDLHGLNREPSYVAAGASAAGYVLYNATDVAFRDCKVSPTADVDEILFDFNAIECADGLQMSAYDRIVRTLRDMSISTFFGKVKFNANQRNIGKDPITTQVQKQIDYEGGLPHLVIEAVLPVGATSSLLKMPLNNPYIPDCKEGYYKSDDEFEACIECPPGEVSSSINADHCDNCPLGYWMDKPKQSKCNVCPSGTTTHVIGATSIEECKCKEGFYQPNDVGHGFECITCPDGAYCKGGVAKPIALQGYWMDLKYRDEMYECDPPSKCEGGERRECAKGHTGTLCEECAAGYFNILEQCYPCMDKGIIVVIILSLIIAWYILNVVISGNVASLDMLLSWAQLANIVGDVALHWPKILVNLFAVANILDFDVDILEPGCLVQWSFTHNFIVQLLLPILMGTMAGVGYVASRLIYEFTIKNDHRMGPKWEKFIGVLIEIPGSRAELDEKWDYTIAAFLSSIEVTYVTITKYCFDAFKCEEIAGHEVLSTSPDIKCGSAKHKVAMVLGVVGVLTYTVGYLAFISWKLYIMHSRRELADPLNLRRYGFLYVRFELDYYWMSVVVSLRRLLFVLILVFIDNPAFQAAALGVIINASLMLHVYTAPYVDTYLDVLFSFLLVALMFETFGGLMFFNENFGQTDRQILEYIVLSAVLLLALVFIVIFYLELVRKYEVGVLKKLHKGTVLRSNSLSKGGSGDSLKYTQSKTSKREISFELLETFDPGFLYKALHNDEDHVWDWDRLTDMLKDYMSDQSATSYLSLDNVAKFWRKLVGNFPELVDFLAITDEATRNHFSEFANALYKDFYLKKKVDFMPIYRILNWRDRAALAQWLAMADAEEREFFTSFMARMMRKVHGEEAGQEMKQKVQHSGRHQVQLQRSVGGESSRALTRSMDTTIRTFKRIAGSQKRSQIIEEIEKGGGPFSHPARSSFKPRINAIKSALSLSKRFSSHKSALIGTEEEEGGGGQLTLNMRSMNRSDSKASSSDTTMSRSGSSKGRES